MKHYCEEQSTVLHSLETNRETGLTESEASTRLIENGRNKLAAAKKKSIARRFLEQLADPMIIILIVAAFISGALAIYEISQGKEGEFVDVIIILAVVIINAVLGNHQD